MLKHVPDFKGSPFRLLAAALLLFATASAVYWSGFGANDSGRYSTAALMWVESGPYLPASHWSLRHLIVLPIAASYALFGPSELAAAIPNFLYAAGLVAISLWFGRRYLGDAAALALAGLAAVSAALVDASLEVSVHGVTIFFTALSFWLFLGAQDAPKRHRRGALAGVAAAGAWLCTEASVFIPAAFLAFALVTPGRRSTALAAALGFVAVIMLEMATYAIVAGDPLYRYRVDLNHGGGRGVGSAFRSGADLLAIVLRPVRHLLTDPASTPFLVLGSLVWLSNGFRRHALSGKRRMLITLFGIGAATSFLSSTFAFDLKSPQYYLLLHYFALISLAVFASWLATSGHLAAAASVAGALVILSFAIADFRTYGDKYEARQLIRYVVEHQATVATDPKTAGRARPLLHLEGLTVERAAALVRSTNEFSDVLCGKIFVATPIGATPAIQPAREWRRIAEFEPRATPWTHAALRALGLDERGPGKLRETIAPKVGAALYEAPPCPA